MQVTILDDSRSEKCEGRCGLDLSSPGRMKSIAELLKKLYGESVQLAYHNLSDSSVEDSHPTIAEEARLDELTLPLLLINGKPRISGYFDFRLMQDVIQAEMEIDSE
jgi:disulfide oxidoreductase YuzD